MDADKLIQVSFQIPPSALDSLSRLTEQLRMLTESASAQYAPAARTAKSEHEESGTFDPERFQALLQGDTAQPQTAGTEFSDTEDAKAVPAATSQLEDAETVSATVSQTKDAAVVSATVTQTESAAAVSAAVRKELQNAASAGTTLDRHSGDEAEASTASDPRYTPLEERDFPLPPAEAAVTGPASEIPAVRMAAEKVVPEAPGAVRDAEQLVPGVERVRVEAEARELAAAASQAEVSGGIETPMGAGVVVQTQPEAPQSRWSNVTEELVIPGPAPLTAEAVSLAFERDGRRYDNGFPLY